MQELRKYSFYTHIYIYEIPLADIGDSEIIVILQNNILFAFYNNT